MTREEFTLHVDRLKSTWPTSFPEEKVRLIWVATNQLNAKWFEKLVNDMIANNRQAPLPAEFIQSAHQEERKNIFSFPKRDEIQPIENSIFSKDDIAEMFSMIKKKMRGEISYKELEAYGKMIEHTVNERKACKICDDGLVHAFRKGERSSPYVFKCRCKIGAKHVENFPFWNNQNGFQTFFDDGGAA